MSATDGAINGGAGPVATEQPLPTQAQLPPGFEQFAADLDLVLVIAFSELFAGFDRMAARDAHGNTLWREKQGHGYGPELTAEQLPSFKDTKYALCEWLDNFCNDLNRSALAGQQFLWSIQRTSRRNADGKNLHVAGVFLFVDGTGLPQPVGKGTNVDPAFAIASAMLDAAKMGALELAALHRELFPHRYLAVVEDEL